MKWKRPPQALTLEVVRNLWNTIVGDSPTTVYLLPEDTAFTRSTYASLLPMDTNEDTLDNIPDDKKTSG